MESQKGYLLLTAALLVVLGSIAVAASYMFVSSTQSVTNSSQANKAFYIAVSGMEIASRYLLGKNVFCTNITGLSDLTNASFGGGEFTVTGTESNKNTTLSSAVSVSSTSIPLTSTTGFANSGVVSIDNEYIFYPSISGSSLINVDRGLAGTVPASHANSANVNQTQCSLISTAGYPNLTLPLGKRTLQRFYIGKTFQVPVGGNYTNTAIISAKNVTLNNNGTIINPGVTTTSPNFSGSTIVSSGRVTLNKNGVTKINSSSGLVNSSIKGSLKSDVVQNNTTITSNNLFGYFFNQSKATIQAGANQNYDSTNINGANGITIWVTGNLTLIQTTVVGSPTSPVILIVNGNLTLDNSAAIYGFVYATGNVTLNKSNLIYGSVASEGNIVLNFTSTIQYDQSILSQVQQINNHLTMTYVQSPAATLEVYN